MINVSVRGVRFAPILVGVILTVLLFRLFQITAHIFVFLFIGVLISLYLGAVTDWFERRLGINRRLAFAGAVLFSGMALAALFWVLIPPVVAQTQALVRDLPGFVSAWEKGLDDYSQRSQAFGAVWRPNQHQVLHYITEKVTAMFSDVVPMARGIVTSTIHVFAIGVMAIYLALHPALYREWLIALFPPIHRDLVRDLLSDLATTLRSWMVGQLLAMSLLAALTAFGLWVLNVPFWLAFGIFTGLVAIVPFFGTLVSTALPALFVLNGEGYYGFGSFAHAMLVVGLGTVVHLVEGNVVAPMVMSKKIDLPPVLTIMAVLVMERLMGPLGLIVALPTLAAIMVVVRRILITRIYEGQGFRKATRERPVVLRVPAPGGGVLTSGAPPIDILSYVERQADKKIA